MVEGWESQKGLILESHWYVFLAVTHGAVIIIIIIIIIIDRLVDLVVSMSDNWSWGPRHFHKF